MANKKRSGKTLQTYKGYKIFAEYSYDVKGVITKTNLWVISEKKGVRRDKFKNKESAIAFIDTL